MHTINSKSKTTTLGIHYFKPADCSENKLKTNYWGKPPKLNLSENFICGDREKTYTNELRSIVMLGYCFPKF